MRLHNYYLTNQLIVTCKLKYLTTRVTKKYSFNNARGDDDDDLYTLQKQLAIF